jgi:predicted pyridoxine 5'-phosphate oxidase superfamily flavin-nucleotide-binding protein
MAQHFTEIAFTPSVKAVQERFGSRAAYSRVEAKAGGAPVSLGLREIAFIEARDGFYQATVSETGWPYVQFRGGPAGFLKVLDDRTLGYADFRGNVQYLSVGNMTANDRVALILMDYAGRQRLKIWARARLVHPEEDAALVARLEMPTYRARVERAVLLSVEAFDWNCPQHITPRFTAAEIEDRVRPLYDRITELEAQIG